MADELPTAEQIERERFLMRVFGSYEAYLKSLPYRVWESGKRGWVSRPR
jgi:hypothetical protein